VAKRGGIRLKLCPSLISCRDESSISRKKLAALAQLPLWQPQKW